MTKLNDAVLKYFQQARPLILIGMHRSGTSLTTRLLMGCHVFMGHRLSINSECPFLRSLNQRIFGKAGAQWSEVESLTKAMQSEEFVNQEVARLRKTLFDKGKIRRFFGPRVWPMVYHQSPPLWGWKDPRTTITFPAWLRIFPRARFVHVIRHGIDVAISLHQRALKHSQWWKRFMPAYNYSSRMFDFAVCFRLWEEYVLFALEQKWLIAPDCYLEVHYEDLLIDPEGTLGKILDFAEIAIENNELRKVCRLVKRGRRENSQVLSEYQQEIRLLPSSPLFRELGY